MKKSPSPIDKHVGSRVRMRRLMIKMSQEKLGKKLGITFQQVQKYENGANRIGAGRLQHISTVLGVPVAFFFEGLPDGATGKVKTDVTDEITELLSTSAGMDLVRAFNQIADRTIRTRILHLVKALARSEK